jgi:hypothetical protein
MARDGSILNPNLAYAMGAPGYPAEVLTGSGSSGIRLSDLPPGTLKALQQRAPGTRVASIEKQLGGNKRLTLSRSRIKTVRACTLPLTVWC